MNARRVLTPSMQTTGAPHSPHVSQLLAQIWRKHVALLGSAAGLAAQASSPPRSKISDILPLYHIEWSLSLELTFALSVGRRGNPPSHPWQTRMWQSGGRQRLWRGIRTRQSSMVMNLPPESYHVRDIALSE